MSNRMDSQTIHTHKVGFIGEEDRDKPMKLERQSGLPPTEAKSRQCFVDKYASMDGSLLTNWQQVPRLWFAELKNNKILEKWG